MTLVQTPMPVNTPVGEVEGNKYRSYDALELLAALAALTSATRIFPITPSDTVDVSPAPLFLRVTGAGNLRLKGADNAAVTIAVVVGETIAIKAQRVLATGTTATVVGFA